LEEKQRPQKNGNLSLITTFETTHLRKTNLTTDDNLFTADVYVLYLSQYPDKTTVKDVLKMLKKNKLDVSKLVEFSTEYCQYGK
jgi:hypothetical protein